MTAAKLIDDFGIFQLYRLDGKLVLRGKTEMIDDSTLKDELGGSLCQDGWTFDLGLYEHLKELVLGIIFDYECDKLARL
jgi:hypothetical protein